MTTSIEFQAALEKSVVNMDRLDEFVNGPVDTTVPTDNGPIPTMAEFLQQQTVVISDLTVATIPGLATALDGKAATSHIQAATTVTIDDGASGTKFTTVQGFRAYLLGNAGASQTGWRRAGTATDQLLSAILEKNAVTPEDFGALAIEDGASASVSQTTALTSAINSGRLVNCRGKTYNIGTPIVPGGAVKGIVKGNFAWTTTTAMQGQQFMLSIIDKDDVVVMDNSFNLGTVEDCGSNDDSGRGAIKVSSSNEGVIFIKRPRVERNRVTGNGNGTGIYVRSATSPRVNFNIVQDRIVGGTSTNDAQNGIDVSRSSDVQCDGNIVDGLYYRITGTATRAWSRGIVAVEVTGGSYGRNLVSNVDQGMDFSGGIISGFPNGNTAIACIGNVVHDVRTWGIKFANCIRNSVCTGNVVRNFGWGGIVISGQSAAWTAGQEAKATSHLLIANNYVCDPADYYGRTDCIGIWVIFRTAYPGYPSQIRIINNTVTNTTGNGRLLHGISQDDGDGAHNIVAGAPFNEVSGNSILGQTGTPTKGCTPLALCALTDAASQSIPNATWTSVAWTTETLDGQGMHSNSSNPEMILPNGDGWYEVGFTLLFSESAAGNRIARILRSGGSVAGGEVSAAGLNGANVSLSNRCLVYLSAGQNLRVEVYQNSTVSLNVLRANSQFYARRIEQM